MNTLANMGAMFFFTAFAFLEKQPSFKCQLDKGSSSWTLGTPERPLEQEYCSSEYLCEVDMANSQSFNNLIAQFDFYCEAKWKIGMMGFMFLVGIVLGCSTIARLGDVYGRKPIYNIGLLMHLAFSVIICFISGSSSILLLYGLLVFFGVSVTARFYVGYTYNLEMQPKEHQPFVSTVWFLSESLVYLLVCFYFQSVSKDWIYLQLPNIALTVLGICVLLKMPESPRFLLAQGKTEEAKEVFATIAKFNGIPAQVVDGMDLIAPRVQK